MQRNNMPLVINDVALMIVQKSVYFSTVSLYEIYMYVPCLARENKCS